MPIAFVDGDRIVGIGRGGMLFAADAERGHVLWGANAVLGSPIGFGQGSSIAVAPTRDHFALWNRRAVQVFDVDTGFAVTDVFEPLSLLGGTPADGERAFDQVELTGDGGVTARCDEYNDACAGQTFVRKAPAPGRSACQSLAGLAGRDVSGRRLDRDALLAALAQEESCRARRAPREP